MTLFLAMFFTLSKLFWIVAAPSDARGLLVGGPALCLGRRKPRAATAFACAAVALMLVAWLAALPLARAWENRYPRPPWPSHVDGILVLGGGYDSVLLHQRH